MDNAELIELWKKAKAEIQANLDKTSAPIIIAPWPLWKDLLLRVIVGIPLLLLGWLCLQLLKLF